MVTTSSVATTHRTRTTSCANAPFTTLLTVTGVPPTLESSITTPSTFAPGDRLLQRVLWTLVYFGLLVTSLSFESLWYDSPLYTWIGPFLVLVALAGALYTWITPDTATPRFQHLSMLTVTLSAGLCGASQILSRVFYNTDAAAFNQVATNLLLHGHNPYTSSMGSASSMFPNVSNFWTYMLNGSHVTSYSYPAGSLFLQAPLQWLGVTHLTTDWLDLGSWIATALLAYLVLPRSLRFLPPLLLLFSDFFTRFTNGGTDAMFLPFLLLALWRWDRFSDLTASRWLRYLGPLSLGLACSIKQGPWFCVPFVVVGVFLESYALGYSAWKAATGYAFLTALPFGALNLPFILANPQAWLRGAFLPMTSPLIPSGSGLIDLATHGAIHALRLHYLMLAGLALWALIFVCFICFYAQMKRAWLFALPLVLFIPSRSLSSYLLDYLPVALVAGLTVLPARRTVTALFGRLRYLIVALPLLGFVALLGLSLSAPVLTLSVPSFTTDATHSYLQSVTVTLTNNTSSPVTTHLTVASSDSRVGGFWTSPLGPSLTVPAGSSSTVTLYPPTGSIIALPSTTSYFDIEALSASPASIVSSGPQEVLPAGLATTPSPVSSTATVSPTSSASSTSSAATTTP